MRNEHQDPPATLLIVDDDPFIRGFLSEVLAEIKFSVRSAPDGFSALAEIRKEIPGILLSDINMPGMSGFELLSVVRRRFPAILVIAMSGSFSGKEVPSGVPADAFYQKGSSLGALLQIIRTLHQRQPRLQQTSGTTSPLWIQRNGCDSTGFEYVLITCPECLNTSPQAVGGSDYLMREMDCIHCGYLIRYAIVASTDSVTPQTIQHTANTVCPTTCASTFNN